MRGRRSLSPLPDTKERGIDENYCLWWIRQGQKDAAHTDHSREPFEVAIKPSAELPKDSLGRETETITLEEWKAQQ
jgi:hypothetical protein